MTDWTIPSLTTATFGFTPTKVQIGNEILSINVGENQEKYSDFILPKLKSSKPGFLTGRRLFVGQVYPRGVFNR